MRRAALAGTLLLAVALSPAAWAEEGLFVGRLGGGICMIHPDMPVVGGTLGLDLDYTFTERLGAASSAVLELHEQATTLGLGLGFKVIPLERRWWRLYVHLTPEVLLVWRPDQDLRADFALRGGLVFEYVFMWGLGFAIELYGTAPVGLGSAAALDAAAAGAMVGPFMEF